MILNFWLELDESYKNKKYKQHLQIIQFLIKPVGYLSTLLQTGSSNWVHKTRIHHHFEALCYKLDPVTEFIKLGSTPQARHHFGTKTSQTALPSKRLHPFYI